MVYMNFKEVLKADSVLELFVVMTMLFMELNDAGGLNKALKN